MNILLNSFPKKIHVFDTTLRDGEQTPGVALKPEDKELIAKKLDEFGVDVVEAGMAITSPGEMEAIKRISKLGLNAEICSGCRCAIKDIEASLKCDVDSIHLIVPTSELHQKYKLKKSKEEVIQLLIECVTYAKEHGLIVELSAEDGSRTDLEYLIRVFQEGIKAGADRVCVCDTVGIMTPERIYKLFSELRPKISKPLSVHCHNDFGMAVANSIAALRAGANQFHATVNGIGERAGNASLEEIVMSLKLLYGIDLGIKTEKIYELSRIVSKLTKIALQPNKAIVGDNAFTHESGIHTHGVLAMPLTYEPFEPELVGRRRRFVAGKHAGSHAIKVMLEEMGYKPNEEQFKLIFNEVKKLGDMGKRVTDSDLAMIAENVLGITSKNIVNLDELTVVTGNKTTPMAVARIKVNDKEYIESGIGVGPVDAAINAIEKALTEVTGIYLEKYEVEAISGGTDAIVDVSVQLRLGDRVVSARGASGDIVMASVEAVLIGMNKLLSMNNSRQCESR